jgi:hypothetical protein
MEDNIVKYFSIAYKKSATGGRGSSYPLKKTKENSTAFFSSAFFLFKGDINDEKRKSCGCF